MGYVIEWEFLKKKIIIGRKDKANFPSLGLQNLDIKMDTGAYTSSIHCRKIELKSQGGQNILTFTLLDPSHPKYQEQEFTSVDFREKQVKNSFGTSERRFVIKTEIILFGCKYPIQLSLSERGEMKFPILIGRRFLMGKFIVDTSLYDLSYKKKKEKLRNKNTNQKT